MQPTRMRARRPILTAMKNPGCSCTATNPDNRRGSFRQATPVLGSSPAVTRMGMGLSMNAQPYQAPLGFRQPPVVGLPPTPWLPATTGPRPVGATTWVAWTGGATGMKVSAGSAIQQPVSITQTMPGGPSGVMVLTSPTLVLNPTDPITPVCPRPPAGRT